MAIAQPPLAASIERKQSAGTLSLCFLRHRKLNDAVRGRRVPAHRRQSSALVRQGASRLCNGPDDPRTQGENLWITRRAGVARPGCGDETEDRAPDPGAAATAHAGRSNRVINSFPPTEEGPLSPGKFFGIMALSGIFRDDPRRSVRPSINTTVCSTLLFREKAGTTCTRSTARRGHRAGKAGPGWKDEGVGQPVDRPGGPRDVQHVAKAASYEGSV
jgi:hypothetical protein